MHSESGDAALPVADSGAVSEVGLDLLDRGQSLATLRQGVSAARR